MPCGLTPNQILPRRYVLRAGVQSPLTCRHPKHLRCSCHGQPPAAVAQKPTATNSNTRSTRAAAHEQQAAANSHAGALRRQEQEYKAILADILRTIRNFPDAAAAVSAMLDDGPPAAPQPDHPDTGNV